MPKRSRLIAPLSLLTLALAPQAFAATAEVDPRIEQVLTELGKAQSIQATAISPDGKQLAWVIQRDGKPAIEVANADGSHARRVTAAARRYRRCASRPATSRTRRRTCRRASAHAARRWRRRGWPRVAPRRR
jgi:hypothetical protein